MDKTAVVTATDLFLARRWRRFALVMALFATAMLLLLVLNVALGSVNIPLGDTVRIVLGQGGDDVYQSIIWNIRLPRALGALAGGAVLAVSGLLLQVFFRNPIVGPFILGISSGASFAVALVLLGSYVLGATAVSTLTVSAAAFIGHWRSCSLSSPWRVRCGTSSHCSSSAL